jgi:hypothetical protein
MSRHHSYYTLVASLPWLPRFDKVERLPISERRLGLRLAMLHPEDAEVVKRARAFMEWRHHPTTRTDEEMVAHYNYMYAAIQHPVLRELAEREADKRTIIGALRRRHLERPAPVEGEIWGIGQWVGHIQRHWDVDDFSLGKIYPWIPEARTYIEHGETLALNRLITTEVWNYIEQTTQGNEFGFEIVLAYLFKWYILQQWCCRDSEAAKVRFNNLVVEVMNEHTQLFN